MFQPIINEYRTLSPKSALCISSHYGGNVIGRNGSHTIDPKTKDALSDCNPFYFVINQDIFSLRKQWHNGFPKEVVF